jgi:ribonuclease HI
VTILPVKILPSTTSSRTATAVLAATPALQDTALSFRTSLGRKSSTSANTEYQGLIAALEYTLQHGPKALKLISDSELLVRQIKGIYKVKNATLQDLHGRAKELIAQLEWFAIGHALREHNREADRLANEAMDKGMGRRAAAAAPAVIPAADPGKELEGVIRNGAVELTNGKLPEGTRVQVRAKR